MIKIRNCGYIIFILIILILFLYFIRRKYEFFVVSEEENIELDACGRTCLSLKREEREECVSECQRYLNTKLKSFIG